MNTPYISKVQIKNYRNFLDVNINLSHKQVIVGENNCGKTNFLRALQLILDSSFSDQDRYLQLSDFHDSLVDPMKNGQEIEISIEVQGYERHTQLLAKFRDAVVNDYPPTLRITYKYYPLKDANDQIITYEYKIYLGSNEQNIFTSSHRNLLNLKVIKALRDVEREMKSLRRSPMYQLVQQFDLNDDELQEIADELKDASNAIMDLDEIIEIKGLIQGKFKTLSGNQVDCDIELSTFDIEPAVYTYNPQFDGF